jgi:hypothetical protein
MDRKYNQKVMRTCCLHMLPDKRTFDRRFKTIQVRDAIAMMCTRFVTEHLVDTSIS